MRWGHSTVSGGGTTTAQEGSSSGLQTAKLGQVLTSAQLTTGSTSLIPAPGALTGWDDSLSVATGMNHKVGQYAAPKGRFVVANLSFGPGAMDKLAKAVGGQLSATYLTTASSSTTPTLVPTAPTPPR